jgi:hypothetical protein
MRATSNALASVTAAAVLALIGAGGEAKIIRSMPIGNLKVLHAIWTAVAVDRRATLGVA